MRHQQVRRAAERQQVGAVPPVAVEQNWRYSSVICGSSPKLHGSTLIAAGLRSRVCSASCRKCPSVQYRCTNDRSLRTSCGGVLARHDAEPIRPAAVAPAARHLLIALIAVGDVQAQGMVVGAFLRDAIVAVGPGGQLHAGAQQHAAVQPRLVLTQCFKRLIVGHRRPRCSTCRQCKEWRRRIPAAAPRFWQKAQEYATGRKALQAPPRAKADTAPSVFRSNK